MTSDDAAAVERSLVDLGEPMRRALEQAWEAHVRGNVGVGAALSDAAGAVMAIGRNRTMESDGPPGRLFGSFLAHAEMDVLAQVRTGEASGETLWTTLQPCLLCTSATVLSKVPQVVFLAADPLWDGTERLHELNAQTARRWPARRGPLGGPLAVFASLLPLCWYLERQSTGAVFDAHEQHAAPTLALARRLHAHRTLISLGEGPLDVALAALWPDLCAACD